MPGLIDRTVLLRRGSWIFVTYGLFVAAAFLWQFVGGLAYAAMAGRALRPVALFYLLLFWPSVVVGGRLLSALLHPRRLWLEPRRALLEPGYMLHGGVLGGLVSTVLWALATGRPVLGELDAIAFAAPLTESWCRLGCLLYGCCWGRPTSCRLGMAYSSRDAKVLRVRPHLRGVALHPVQLYTAGVHAAQFVALVLLATVARFDGLVVGFYLATHSVARWVLERYRADDRGVLVGCVSMTAVYAGITLVLGFGIITVGAHGSTTSLHTPEPQWWTVLANPMIAALTLLSTLLVAAAFGIHRHRVGSWIAPRKDDAP
jgi:phosphatidylglycerol:prolipoprotein diacylglycerol transferase